MKMEKGNEKFIQLTDDKNKQIYVNASSIVFIQPQQSGIQLILSSGTIHIVKTSFNDLQNKLKFEIIQ